MHVRRDQASLKLPARPHALYYSLVLYRTQLSWVRMRRGQQVTQIARVDLLLLWYNNSGGVDQQASQC